MLFLYYLQVSQTRNVTTLALSIPTNVQTGNLFTTAASTDRHWRSWSCEGGASVGEREIVAWGGGRGRRVVAPMAYIISGPHGKARPHWACRSTSTALADCNTSPFKVSHLCSSPANGRMPRSLRRMLSVTKLTCDAIHLTQARKN